MGGITAAEDAIEFMLAGATAVQVGTASYADPRAVERIASGLRDWCHRHHVDRIASLTAQIGRLQRARASTVRAAHYATVDLQLTTPQPAAPVHRKPGPLHGLGIAFHWAWIGAVYALALGTPLAALLAAVWLLARAVRRRREDRLLAR